MQAEYPRLHRPHFRNRAPEREGLGIELEAHRTALSGSEPDLLKTLQLAGRACHGGFGIGHIELHHFSAALIARIHEIDGDGEARIRGGFAFRSYAQVLKREARIAETESERIFRREILPIRPAVAEEDAFAIFHARVRARIAAESRMVFPALHPGDRQLARGVDAAEQDVGDRRAAFLAG